MRNVILLGSAAVLGVVFGVFAGCGGGGGAQQTTQTPTASAQPSASESASAAPTESAAPSASASAAAAPSWDQLNHAQRLEVMKTVVVPKLGADFKGFDAKKFDHFGCTTCHGERIKQGNFKMPNPGLPHLSYTDGFKKERDKHPAMLKFMMDKVEPDMVAAIGEKPYDPKTNTGFGCGGCHIVGP